MRLFASVILILFLAFASVRGVRAQETGQAERPYSGTIHVTNNGVSLIPNFTLGKPALISYTKIGTKRLTFQPRMQFALAGKPWAFIFRWRYEVVNDGKFRLQVGANPTLSYVTSSIIRDGEEEDAIIARRFMAGEIVPDYSLTENLNIGMYYLYSRGLQTSTVRNVHYISFMPRLSNIALSDAWTLGLNAQLYGLILDDETGAYVSSSVALAKKDFPISFEGLVNIALKTEISGDEFLWSLSAVYSY